MTEEGLHRDAPGALGELLALDAIEPALWDEVLDAFALVRSAYAGARGGYAPDAFDIWRTSQLACSLHWYFRVLQVEPPSYATTLANVADGTGLIGHRQLCRILRGATLEQLTGERLTALALREAPTIATPRFQQLVETLVDGRPRGVGRVPVLAGQLDALLVFGASFTGLERVIWTYHLARRFLYADLVAVLGASPELQALLAAPGEPAGFEIVEPSGSLAAVSADARAAWFSKIAELAVPLALDSSDAVIRDGLRRLSTIMGEPRTGNAVAHALATYDKLDALFGEMLAFVEYGLRRACRVAATTEPFDAAARDRIIRSPRAYFDTLRSARPAA